MPRGDCYTYAARRIMDEPRGTRARVVHGTIMGGIRHAWFEKGGLVFDYQTHGRRLPGHRKTLGPAQEDGVPVEEWYAATGAVAVESYTRMETVRRMLKEGHYGPWESF